MKRIVLSLFMALLSLSFLATPVEAKRLGGGSSSGMKRTTPPPQPVQPTPAKPAAAPTATTPAAAPATPPKRSWMGPIAGIAAGLGIAALMSHFGMGGDMANILTMVLFGVAALFLVRFLMQRFGPGAAARNQQMRLAPAGAAPFGNNSPAFGSGSQEPSFAAAAPAVAASSLPVGFDAPAFERIAKLIFIRMQAANDAGNLEDLRQFATPEMFATFRLELQERKANSQQTTDVVQLNAQVLDFAQEADKQIVSVRFHGLIREEKDAATTTFDEIWHLVKPADGSADWAIAGITQSEVA